MKRYFNNVETLVQLRKQYKELLKRYHPDNGGSEEITKAINTEYDQLFKVLKYKHEHESTENSQNNTKSDYDSNTYDW